VPNGIDFLCRKTEGKLDDKLELCEIKQKHEAEMRKKIHLLFLWGVLALFSSIAYAEDKKLVFKLTKGQGTEVCEVYLQRLNATEFVDFLGVNTKLLALSKVTAPLQKDFADLQPIPLTAEQIQRIYYKITSFNTYRDQNLREKFIELHKDDAAGKLAIEREKKLPENIKSYMNDKNQPPFVRYQKKLDMDNDGIATDTVINNNYSLYIVDESLSLIDEAKMMAIFADQELLEWPTIVQFPPLAVLTNVFNYKGKYYFDGFLNLQFINTNIEFSVDDSEALKIGVFIHQQKHTQKVCEYQILDGFNDYWTPRAYRNFL
jgi:hypothetical protein